MDNIDSEFEKTVQYLYNQLPMFQRDGASAYKKDLFNTIKLCDYLDHPERKFKSVHVAGTNGKGSSSHFLAAIFQQAGYKTGLYTSPHLKSFTERIKINGKEIEKKAVVEFVRKIEPLISEISPSFFEITVAMCFEYFAHEKVDIAIIEVGMGGRLDSTNVIQPEVSLITNISLDHQQWLGDTVEEIALEKGGIIKTDTPVVISERQPVIAQIFKNLASERKTDIFFAEDNYKVQLKQDFDVKRNGIEYCHLSKEIGASYQTKNVAGVLKVVELLNEKGYSLHKEEIINGLENAINLTHLKGRWQQLGSSPNIFCDVGHNVGGINYVLNQIDTYAYEKLHFVLGMVNDKDITKVLEILPIDAFYYFCKANIPRALNASDLQKQAVRYNLNGIVVEDVNEAIKKAKENASNKDFIFIGGSNFVVAEIDNL